MRLDLTAGEISTLQESLRYSIRHMEEYAGQGKCPPGYDWRAESVGPLKSMMVKLSAAKKGNRK